MDVEQVTSNRCAQISRVRHENRWWDLKMSKSLGSVNTPVAIKCKTRSSATLFISNVCLSLQVSALCCFIQRYCISQCFFFFFFSLPLSRTLYKMFWCCLGQLLFLLILKMIVFLCSSFYKLARKYLVFLSPRQLNFVFVFDEYCTWLCFV